MNREHKSGAAIQEAVDQRLMDIESKLAYQEDLLDSLNDIVIKQSEELTAMHKRMEKMAKLVGGLLEGDGKGQGDEQEVPPHY